ncbi:MAG: RnfABCDGE type electron transport complex subunit D [Lentisphaerae bacterium]|nr:RnfABCDGE type electron transport complex subunit D [Lentisphaerota bacterium]
MSDQEQKKSSSCATLRRVLAGAPEARAQERYLLAAGASALLCLAYGTAVLGPRLLWLALLTSLAGLAVELVFARVRRKPLTGGAVVYGLLLALLLPVSLPWWVAVLGAAFGTVFAKEVFGGAKNSVFNPVLVAAGFVVYSYPTIFAGTSFAHLSPLAEPANAWQIGALLCLACALLLVVVQPSALWIYLGIAIGAYGVARFVLPESVLPFEGDLRLLFTANGFMVIGCLLSVDPAGAPQRWFNRLLFGLIIGVAAVTMRCFSLYENAMLSALLLANIFAPTLDLLFAGRAKA